MILLRYIRNNNNIYIPPLSASHTATRAPSHKIGYMIKLEIIHVTFYISFCAGGVVVGFAQSFLVQLNYIGVVV